MRVIAELPPRSTRRRRYDWDLILDGTLRELEWGVDFDCRPSSFAVTIRRAARERGAAVVVHSYLQDDRPVVAVQALNRTR
ncbi:MAG TPA: hypothetical protein VFF79_16685 [Conexibacter sp.]|jgi:hypothetical protein|nr:hypothetical protein [Conexibacter sp.]